MKVPSLLLSLAALALVAQQREEPLFRAVDVNQGEQVDAVLANGTTARVELIERRETADTVRGAVRLSQVRVRVNREEVWLECGNYRLPVAAGGVQIDCSVTKGLLANSRTNPWAIEKDARLRLWPAGSPFLQPGTYVSGETALVCYRYADGQPALLRGRFRGALGEADLLSSRS
jgi:hypothetical protein